MCGIITALSTSAETTTGMVREAYARQYTRGSDGFGFVSVEGTGKVHAHKRCETIETAHKLLKKHASNTVMFHHRLPTSTPNVAESNHPIKVSHKSLRYDYYVIHNGVITNADERYTAHSALGFTYTTAIAHGFRTRSGTWYLDGDTDYNDSEALAVDIALVLEGQIPAVLAKGASAYVVLQVKKKSHTLRRIYYGRNTGNPLHVYRKKDSVLITSQNVTGKGVQIESDILYGLDARGRKVERRDFTVPLYTSTYNGYGFNLYSGYTGEYAGLYRDGTQERVQEKLPAPIETPATTDTSDKVHELEAELASINEYIELATDYLKDAPHDTGTLAELAECIETRKELEAELAQAITLTV